MTAGTLNKFINNGKNITHVTVGNSINDLGLKAISQNLLKLKFFRLYNNVKITEECLTKVLESCRDIKYLSIMGCIQLSDNIIHQVTTHLPHLKAIFLYRLIKITENALKRLISSCYNLEYLGVQGCRQDP